MYIYVFISSVSPLHSICADSYPPLLIIDMCVDLGKHEHNVDTEAVEGSTSPSPTKDKPRPKPLFAATVCVCPPWDFTLDYHTPVYGAWMRILAFGLKEYFYDHQHVFEAADIHVTDQIRVATNVWGIDAVIANPVHGFRDIHDYYWHASAAYAAKYIDVPTLAISSQDDPVCSVHGCPDINNLVTAYHAHASSIPSHIKQDLEVDRVTNSNLGAGLVMIRTVLGGHLGYMAAPACFFLQTDTWVDRLSLEWFDKFQ